MLERRVGWIVPEDIAEAPLHRWRVFCRDANIEDRLRRRAAFRSLSWNRV